jgi:hypothetical protein
MRPAATTRRLLLPTAILLSVAACGGGGGGGNVDGNGNLHVGFAYGLPSASILQDTAISPTLSGLGSNTPHFAVESGSLPPGTSLDSSTGAVRGVPTTAGSYSATIRLSVDGYSGTLDATLLLTVSDIYLLYDSETVSTVGYPMTAMRPHLTAANSSVYLDSLPGVVLDPAVTITYSVAPGNSLPAGLTLDPISGVIAGTPGIGADSNGPTVINATLTYQGVDTVLSAGQGWGEIVGFPGQFADFNYYSTATLGPSGCCFQDSSPLSATPTLNGVSLVGNASYPTANYTLASGGLPPGLSLDPSTGVISGSPDLTGLPDWIQWHPVITTTLTQGSVSGPITAQNVYFYYVKPL